MGNVNADLTKLEVSVTITDTPLIVALLARARRASWDETCRIVKDKVGQFESMSRQQIISAIGNAVVKAATRDEDLVNSAIDHSIG